MNVLGIETSCDETSAAVVSDGGAGLGAGVGSGLGAGVGGTQRAAEALDIAAREEPELVFLDVDMPRLDGIEACARLRGHLHRCGHRGDPFPARDTLAGGATAARKRAAKRLSRARRAALAASAASFQPLNAHTRAGARSPSGRQTARQDRRSADHRTG